MIDEEEEYSRNIIDPNSSVVYMALSILCASQSSLVPEILYLLSPKQIIDFIKVFGGETLRIPTTDEFSRDLMVALVCYHIIVEEKSWDWVSLKYDMDGNYMRGLKIRVDNWWSKLSVSEKDFINGLKFHEKARQKHEEVTDGQ
jgi:hypothetical protein